MIGVCGLKDVNAVSQLQFIGFEIFNGLFDDSLRCLHFAMPVVSVGSQTDSAQAGQATVKEW